MWTTLLTLLIAPARSCCDVLIIRGCESSKSWPKAFFKARATPNFEGNMKILTSISDVCKNTQDYGRQTEGFYKDLLRVW